MRVTISKPKLQIIVDGPLKLQVKLLESLVDVKRSMGPFHLLIRGGSEGFKYRSGLGRDINSGARYWIPEHGIFLVCEPQRSRIPRNDTGCTGS